jgi:cell division protein FtsB
LKNQKPINEQIQALENELADLDAKRAALQARIKKLKVRTKQSLMNSFPLPGYRYQK